MGEQQKTRLDAIFDTPSVQTDRIEHISLHQIDPNPYQPRQLFEEEQLRELAQSIERSGVIQPIIVRKKNKRYELVAGERRWRATELAKKDTIPAIVRPITDEQSMEFAMLENLQRENLNPIEEAQGYERLMTQLHLTQQQLAKRVGKSRPYVANMLRLLQLPPSVQHLLIEGRLTNGHARALLGLKNKLAIEPLAQQVVREFWNVRQVERYVQKMNEGTPETTPRVQQANIWLAHEEQLLQRHFGTPVHIVQTKEKGTIEIEFTSEDDLNRLLEQLKGPTQ